MEKFYIITNDMKDANRKITVKIKKCIESYGKKCYLEEQPEEGNFSKIKIPKDIDCVLTVGGDGTLSRHPDVCSGGIFRCLESIWAPLAI